MPLHSRLFLGIAQIHRDSAGSPSGYSAPEEISVFCPDAASYCQRRGQDRPVLRIALTQSFPGVPLKIPVNLASNQLYEPAQRAQECQRLSRITAAFDYERRQMLFGIGVCHFRDEEGHLACVGLDYLAHAPPEDGPHEYIGVNDERFTWHSVSSRGLPGGFPCTPPSTRLRWHPRTRSFRPGPSQPLAWPPVRPPGFASGQGCRTRGSRRGA